MVPSALRKQNAELELELDHQLYGADPLENRDTDLYRGEYMRRGTS